MGIVWLIAGGILCVVWFLIIHAVKLFRMYLVLVENRIPFTGFVFAYCRTTLLNLVIPFKLGEIYRMFVYGRLTGKAGIGVASVIADRFFDTLALVLILIPLLILHPEKISAVSVFLIVFVTVIIFCFAMFKSAYRYLNRYIIINRESRNSMAVLKFLEILNNGYEYIKKLVYGRYALLTLMSFMAWVLEGGLLLFGAKLLGIAFDAGDFSDYITSILSTSHSELQGKYTVFSIILMCILTLISGMVTHAAKRKESGLLS